jgi:hypothetical protein
LLGGDEKWLDTSIAYRNDMYIADQVFPNVPVRKAADKYFIFDKVAWFRNEAGPRAPGTRSVEGGYSLSQGSYSCIEVAFSKLVTDEEEDNADDPLTPRRTAVEFATDKILLAREYDVANIVFDAGTWAASATPGTTWDDPASDPISDIETGKEALVKAVGREPNVMVMGREVWTDLKRHPDLLDLYKYTTKGMITMQQFQALFEFNKVLVGTAIYASAAQQDAYQLPVATVLTDQTVTYSFVWGKNAWLGWVPPSPALAVPAAGYTFTWKQRRVAQFRREEERATKYECLENYDIVATATDAGYEFINVVA